MIDHGPIYSPPSDGQSRRPLRHHRPDEASDESSLATVRSIVQSFYLPGFHFTAELVGGRVLIRAGMHDPVGEHLIWGRPWSLREPIVPYDVAVAAKDCALKVAERTIESRFLLAGQAVFRK